MAGRLFGELNAYLGSWFVSQKFHRHIAEFNKADMAPSLISCGWKDDTVIDKTYKLSDAPPRSSIWETGHARGKVVITWTNTTPDYRTRRHALNQEKRRFAGTSAPFRPSCFPGHGILEWPNYDTLWALNLGCKKEQSLIEATC